MDTLGQILKAWRRINGYSQVEAATLCGLGKAHYHNIEEDVRTDLRMETFDRISQATGISVEKLMMAAALSRKARLERRQQRPEAAPA